MPLTKQDRQHSLYEEGVACAYCHAPTNAEDKDRY
jgi:hypothetical protein